MTLNDLESDLYRRLGFAATPDPVVTTRLRAYLNETHRQILSQKGLAPLRRATVVATSVSGDPFLSLNQVASRLMTLVDRANQRVLTPVPLAELRAIDPGMTEATAIPYCYAIINLSAATTQTLTVPGLSVKSTSVADGASKVVVATIKSALADFHYSQSETVTLNGTTPVNFPSAWPIGSYVSMFSLGLGAAATTAAGHITLHQGTGATGTVLTRILAGYSAPELMTRLQLYPTPQTVITYHIDVELHIDEMVSGGEQPLLPEDFHWVLISGALLKEWQRMEKTSQYDREQQMYREGLGDLKMFVARAVKEDGKNGNGHGLHSSAFGPWYPVGGVGNGAGPHAPTHEPGGTDPMSVDALPTIGSLRTLGSGPNQAAPGDDPRFAAGGGGPHHLTHESGGSDALSVLLLAGYSGLPAEYLDGSGTFSLPPIRLHNTTHYIGQPDVLDLKQLGGYSGVSTHFLNGSGAFSTPSAGVPGAHHATHEPGGGDAMAVDAAAAVGSLRTLGAGANQAAPGNDARFTAPSTPTAHATTHQPGGSDAMAVDAVAATGSLRTLGTGSQQAAAGTDSRLTDARTPTAHQATHRSFGSDPLLVGTLGGYPLTAGVYLDGLGNFTAPAGTTPGPHHATHEPGGGDTLANAAWTNQANTFSLPQTLQMTWPTINLNQSSQPADQKRWHLAAEDGPLYLRSVADSGTTQANTLKLDRNGDATVANNLTANGSGGNVACKDQTNTFTQPQTVSMSSPALTFFDSSQPANLRQFQLVNYQQTLRVWAMSDAPAVLTTPIIMSRNGDVLVGGNLSEKARTTPMGHWIDVPFSAANFSSLGGIWTVASGNVTVNRYTLIGKTMIWTVVLANTTLSGAAAAQVQILLPTGASSNGRGVNSVAQLSDAGGSKRGIVFVNSGGNAIIIQPEPYANYSNGALYVMCSIIVELN